MAGDRQGARPMRAMGPETNTEGSRDPMTSAVLTCVHAGRRVKKRKLTNKRGKGRKPQGMMHSGKGGRVDQNKKKLQCTAGARKAQSEQAAGEREGANVAEEGPGVAREKKKTQLARWKIGTGTGGSRGGARKKGPQQVQKETNYTNKRGREGSDPCKPHETVPGWMRIQWARATGLCSYLAHLWANSNSAPPALKRWEPPGGRSHGATLPTCGPLLILPPALRRWGPPMRQGLCWHLAYFSASSNSAPPL